MKGTPRDMQVNPHYEDVVSEIISFLRERVRMAREDGVEHVVVDPGIGFGKRTEDNLRILRSLFSFRALGLPVLVGTSRKSFIGNVLNLPVEERLEGTLATLVISVVNGASILRVHDVKEAVRAVRMAEAVMGCMHHDGG
jgi:dihydropteroate synthase